MCGGTQAGAQRAVECHSPNFPLPSFLPTSKSSKDQRPLFPSAAAAAGAGSGTTGASLWVGAVCFLPTREELLATLDATPAALFSTRAGVHRLLLLLLEAADVGLRVAALALATLAYLFRFQQFCVWYIFVLLCFRARFCSLFTMHRKTKPQHPRTDRSMARCLK
jgi:hypothetical protein